MILIFIIIILTAAVSGYLYLLKCYGYWKKKKVPFPKPHLFFGNVKSIFYGQTSMGHVSREAYNNFKDCRYVGIYNIRKPALVMRDMDLITDIIFTDFKKFGDNWADVDPTFNPIFAKNPFTAKGPLWKNLRAQLTSQFTAAKMKYMFPLVQEVCENMVNYLEAESNSPIGAKELSEKFTSENIASCAFGMQGNAFTTSPAFWELSKKVMEAGKIMLVLQPIQLFFPLLRKLLMLRFFPESAMQSFGDVVRENLKHRKENNIVSNDFFNFIAELKHKTTNFDYTDEYIVAHAFTFFLDGYDTSTGVFSFALYELAINPHIQVKLKEEIDSVLEKYDGQSTYEAFQEMTYLEKVVLETVRKHPCIPFVGRICTQTCELPSPTGSLDDPKVTIEKGTPVFVPTMGIHYDPKYYPDPQVFDPHRFDSDARKSRPKCTFMGFGEGRRICLGRQFALLQMKAGVAAIISKYEIRINPKTTVPIETDMKMFFYYPRHEVWLDFHRRT